MLAIILIMSIYAYWIFFLNQKKNYYIVKYKLYSSYKYLLIMKIINEKY